MRDVDDEDDAAREEGMEECERRACARDRAVKGTVWREVDERIRSFWRGSRIV